MCFNTKLDLESEQIDRWAKAALKKPPIDWEQMERINGFTKPETLVICKDRPEEIIRAWWGFSELWNGKEQLVLNARSETIREKKTFRDHIHNKCLVLVNGFYEWQWLDSAGKKKQMYLIEKPNRKIFMLEGIYRDFVDQGTGELNRQYVLLTKEAKGIMRKIHNSKKRMPVAYFQPWQWEKLLREEPPSADLDFIATPC